MTVGRVTQTGLEVLLDPPQPASRVTQTGLEVLIDPPQPASRVTQTALEVLLEAFTGDITDLNEGSVTYSGTTFVLREVAFNVNEGSYSYSGVNVQVIIPTNLNIGSLTYTTEGVELVVDRSRLRNFFLYF